MALRLTDTDKWKNPAFRNLPLTQKLIYLYIYDNCDNAGVFHLDLELMSFMLGEKIDKEDITQFFKKQFVFVSEDKLVIHYFVRHQKNFNNPKMEANIKRLFEKHGLEDRYLRGDFG